MSNLHSQSAVGHLAGSCNAQLAHLRLSLQGFSNGMPEQPDMHAVIFNLAVMHGGSRTYKAMQTLYLEVWPSSSAILACQEEFSHTPR